MQWHVSPSLEMEWKHLKLMSRGQFQIFSLCFLLLLVRVKESLILSQTGDCMVLSGTPLKHTWKSDRASVKCEEAKQHVQVKSEKRHTWLMGKAYFMIYTRKINIPTATTKFQPFKQKLSTHKINMMLTIFSARSRAYVQQTYSVRKQVYNEQSGGTAASACRSAGAPCQDWFAYTVCVCEYL